jgi:imidazolonepropionase-like amidohydrolase
VRTAIVILLFLTACASNTAPDINPQYRLDNGLWFDGAGFAPATVYVADGKLRFSSDARPADKTLNLNGGYVVPPYCEAHNHNLGDSADMNEVDQTIAAYLGDGVFYAMMPGSFKYYRDSIAGKINHPKSVDVAFANNGLTGSGGHPKALREFLMERYGNYPEFTKDTLPDKGYFEADTPAQLREKWPLILAEKPDFIKVMLLYSEEYGKRKDDPEFYGKRGLNPALLPELVGLAHDEGLRVAAHVDTDADMAAAINAGVDIIAHLPSNGSAERLSDETILLAAKSGAALVTTLSVAKREEERSPEQYAAIIEAQKADLSRLHAAGANLVIGSDRVWDTSRDEADHIASLGVLDNATLLKAWTENCARTVFPERKIGRLAEGYEASFLVLENDPLADFDNTKNILLRMKDGEALILDGASGE